MTAPTVVWGKVVTWQPGKAFAMTWQLDRPEDEVTYLTITFDAEDGTGTRVTLIHDGWDAVPQRRAGRPRPLFNRLGVTSSATASNPLPQ